PTSVGSLPYCAPEQYAGALPAPTVDVFSWGAVLHQLACGQAGMEPADGVDTSHGGAGQAARTGEPFRRRPVLELKPDFPRRFAAVIDRAVAWEPCLRFADMGE